MSSRAVNWLKIEREGGIIEFQGGIWELVRSGHSSLKKEDAESIKTPKLSIYGVFEYEGG